MSKAILLLANLCIFSSVFTQPIINDAANIPPVGTNYPAAICSVGMWQLGSAGASQTWDLSGFSFSTLLSFSYIDVNGSALGEFLPGAEHCFRVDQFYSYIDVQPDGLYFLAFNANSTDDTGNYSYNSRKYIQFPFTYGTTFSDSYVEFSTLKSVDVSYDGYGTLVMPEGYTYQNIIRTREYEGEGEIITKYYSMNPLTIVGMHFNNSNTFYWSKVSPSAGIEEQAEQMKFFPNPISDEIRIDLNTIQNEVCEIKSMEGRCLLSISPEELNLSQGLINVQSLNPGKYIFSIGLNKCVFIKF